VKYGGQAHGAPALVSAVQEHRVRGLMSSLLAQSVAGDKFFAAMLLQNFGGQDWIN
jgi:hypothetical protein